jgi:hypothetical protein
MLAVDPPILPILNCPFFIFSAIWYDSFPMATSGTRERRLHRAGAVMLVAGIIGFTIRVILVVDHGRYDWGDVFLAIGSAAIAIVGIQTMRAQRRS